MLLLHVRAVLVGIHTYIKHKTYMWLPFSDSSSRKLDGSVRKGRPFFQGNTHRGLSPFGTDVSDKVSPERGGNALPCGHSWLKGASLFSFSPLAAQNFTAWV